MATLAGLKGCTDGDNLLPFFKGDEKQSPRKGFLYWSDDGDLFAIRVGNWKATFIEQEHTGLDVWQKGFTTLRMPLLFNLRADPFERGSEGTTMTTGWPTGCSCLFPRRRSSRSGWRASTSSRPATR
jgi:arylsulfatase A-like enzyme